MNSHPPIPCGDRNAALVALRPLVWRAAARLAGTPADRDDLFQESCLVFLERWGAFDGHHWNLYTRWAVCHARQRFSRRANRDAAERLAVDPPARAETPAVEVAEEAATRAARVRAAVDALPERRRDLITARFGLDGAAPRQLKALAGGLGCSRQAISQQERRALDQLAAILADRG